MKVPFDCIAFFAGYKLRFDVCLELNARFNHPNRITKGNSSCTCDNTSAESVESRRHRREVLIEKWLGRFISVI